MPPPGGDRVQRPAEADLLLRLAGMFDELAGKRSRRPNETDETRLMAFTRPASPRT